MLSSKIGHSFDPLIYRIYSLVFRNRVVSPNFITILAFLFGLLSFVFILLEEFLLAGTFLLISGFFDMFDGAIARSAKKVTSFGGFLDSVLDRYVDLIITFGIFIHFIKKTNYELAAVTFFAAIGIALIPYTKARAESAFMTCNTGILERPERIIIILFGLFFNFLDVAVFILAIFAHLTVIQRIIFVREKVKELKSEN